MEERASFSYQPIGLGELASPEDFDEFVSRAEDMAERLVRAVEDPEGFPTPALLTAHGNELAAVLWTANEAAQRELLELVVPETVSALAPSMVALVSGTRLPARAADGAEHLQDSIMVSACELSGESPKELALAAPLMRRAGEPPTLGTFEVIGERLAPAYRDALVVPPNEEPLA